MTNGQRFELHMTDGTVRLGTVVKVQKTQYTVKMDDRAKTSVVRKSSTQNIKPL